MIEEIQHLKVGFSSYAAGILDSDDAPWQRNNLRNESITFAKVKRDGQSTWELLQSSIWGLDGFTLLDYRKGPVYEAEIKQRSIYGKTVSVEQYLDFYDQLPQVCITSLPSYRLQAWVVFQDRDEELFRHRATGLEVLNAVPFDEGGVGSMKVEVPLTSAEQILFFMRAFSFGKHVSLTTTGVEPEAQAPALLCAKPAVYSETMSLF